MAKEQFFENLHMTSLITLFAQRGESPEIIARELKKNKLPIPENLAITVANIRATASSVINPSITMNTSSSDNSLPALG